MSIKNYTIRILVACAIFIFFIVIGCGPATEPGINSNLGPKDAEDPAAGGFVWGQNDKKTGLPEEEKTNDEIIKRQEEVLKRQEIERQRQEKEKQDILRQQHYNEQLKAL